MERQSIATATTTTVSRGAKAPTTTTTLATIGALSGPVVGGPTVEAATTTLAAPHTTTATVAASATLPLALLTGHVAGLAAAGLVVESLLGEELLLAGGELEHLPAVTALEINVLVHVDRQGREKGDTQKVGDGRMGAVRRVACLCAAPHSARHRPNPLSPPRGVLLCAVRK